MDTLAPDLVRALVDAQEAIADDAVAQIRREVPALVSAVGERELRAAIRAGVARFAELWHAPGETDVTAVADGLRPDLMLLAQVGREEILHALRILIEVCRAHEAARLPDLTADPAQALEVLRQSQRGQSLSTALLAELNRRLERGPGGDRRRAQLDQRLVDLLLDDDVEVAGLAPLLALRGLPRDAAWRVAAFDIGLADDDAVVAEVRHRGDRSGALTVVARHGSQVVVLADRDPVTFVQATHLGVAGPALLPQTGETIADALAALDVARRRGAARVDHHDALLDLVLLGLRPPAVLTAALLDRVRDRDPERQRWLLDTLEAYLDAGGSVTAAARTLHLHRESFRYRLQQLDELIGDALADPRQRLALHVGVKALRVTG